MRERLKQLDELEMGRDLWPAVRQRVPRAELPPLQGPSRSARVAAGVVAVVVAVGGFALLRAVFSTQPGPTGTAPTVSNGAIVFERPVDGGEGASRLWLVMPDGSDERQLTAGGDGVLDRWAAWSPDGGRIAFVRLDYPGSSFGLWITDVNGDEPRMVTPPGLGAARPDWSPDGTRIVFVGVMGETPESGVYVMNADGTALEQIVGAGPSYFPDNPEWSPDGSGIAFSGNYEESASGWDVYVMDPDGSDLRNLTQTPDARRSESVIGWLPNGNLLIWQGSEDAPTPDQTERWLEITRTGETVRVVYEGPAGNAGRRQGPSLSPDGRFVVFDTLDEPTNTVRFVDLETGAVTTVVANAHSPAWQPVPISSEVPVEALPVPEASPWPIGPSDPRDEPTSVDVAVGGSEVFTLYTHCGIDYRVDFDGSFWQSYEVAREPADPFQEGSMTLLTEDVAVFRFDGRQGEAAIYFVRNDSAKPAVGCD